MARIGVGPSFQKQGIRPVILKTLLAQPKKKGMTALEC